LSIYGLGGKMKHPAGSRAASTYKQATQNSQRNAARIRGTGNAGGLISSKNI